MDLNELHELRDEINNLHREAEKAPIFLKIKKVMREAAQSGKFLKGTYDVVLWIEGEIKYLSTPKPPPQSATPRDMPHPAKPTAHFTAAPPVADRVLLGPYLKEIHLSGYKFEDCEDPYMLRDFCSPAGGKWDKYLDELSESQKNTFNLARMKFRLWLKAQGKVPQTV